MYAREHSPEQKKNQEKRRGSRESQSIAHHRYYFYKMARLLHVELDRTYVISSEVSYSFLIALFDFIWLDEKE